VEAFMTNISSKAGLLGIFAFAGAIAAGGLPAVAGTDGAPSGTYEMNRPERGAPSGTYETNRPEPTGSPTFQAPSGTVEMDRPDTSSGAPGGTVEMNRPDDPLAAAPEQPAPSAAPPTDPAPAPAEELPWWKKLFQ
jgi:hypothetical protein